MRESPLLPLAMIFKCRLCKKDFESSSYKPYCDPHAKAYDNFKRAKSRVNAHSEDAQSRNRTSGDVGERLSSSPSGERRSSSPSVESVVKTTNVDVSRSKDISAIDDCGKARTPSKDVSQNQETENEGGNGSVGNGSRGEQCKEMNDTLSISTGPARTERTLNDSLGETNYEDSTVEDAQGDDDSLLQDEEKEGTILSSNHSASDNQFDALTSITLVTSTTTTTTQRRERERNLSSDSVILIAEPRCRSKNSSGDCESLANVSDAAGNAIETLSLLTNVNTGSGIGKAASGRNGSINRSRSNSSSRLHPSLNEDIEHVNLEFSKTFTPKISNTFSLTSTNDVEFVSRRAITSTTNRVSDDVEVESRRAITSTSPSRVSNDSEVESRSALTPTSSGVLNDVEVNFRRASTSPNRVSNDAQVEVINLESPTSDSHHDSLITNRGLTVPDQTELCQSQSSAAQSGVALINSLGDHFGLNNDEDEDMPDPIKEVRDMISEGDAGPKGVLCPVSYNYYYGSDDELKNDVEEEEEEEEELSNRVLSGGRVLSSLGLEPVVFQDDEAFGDSDHNYLPTRYRPVFKPEKTRRRSGIASEDLESKLPANRRRGSSCENSSNCNEEPIRKSRFMGDEEERVDLSQLSLVNILSHMAAYPFSRETELQYLMDVFELRQLQRREKAKDEKAEKRKSSESIDDFPEADDRSITGNNNNKNGPVVAHSLSTTPPSILRKKPGPKPGFKILSKKTETRGVDPKPSPNDIDQGQDTKSNGPRSVERNKRNFSKFKEWQIKMQKKPGRKPFKMRVTEDYYPKVSSLMPKKRTIKDEIQREYKKIKKEATGSGPETKRGRRTRGIKMDYHAINEGELFFDQGDDVITNWTKTKAERMAEQSWGMENKEEEEKEKAMPEDRPNKTRKMKTSKRNGRSSEKKQDGVEPKETNWIEEKEEEDAAPTKKGRPVARREGKVKSIEEEWLKEEEEERLREKLGDDAFVGSRQETEESSEDAPTFDENAIFAVPLTIVKVEVTSEKEDTMSGGDEEETRKRDEREEKRKRDDDDEKMKRDDNDEEIRKRGDHEEKMKIDERDDKMKRDDRDDKTTFIGCCKVCGVESKMKPKMPYCQTHAQMFIDFKRKQLEHMKSPSS